MKKILALLSILLMLAPVLVQPVVASSALSLPPTPFPQSPLAVTSGNCYGCAGYEGSAASGYVTKVTAQWTVPTVTCQSTLPDDQAIMTAVELDGYDSATGYWTGVVIEVGAYCSSGSSTPSANAWVFYQSAATGGGWGWESPFVLTSGHKLSAAISISPSNGKMTITLKDLTDGQSASYTTLMSYWGIAYNYLNTAWWMAARSTDLAQFSPSIKFTGCDVVVSGATHPISWLSSLYEYTMVDNSGTVVQATTSALNKAGTGFSVSFVSST
jgi:hypothetical protein